MFYFVSNKNFNRQILIPRIPNNRLTSDGREDNNVSRICVSKSLLGCIYSTELYTKYKRLYVHICDSNDVIQPSYKQVSDAYLLGEEWILEPVEMRLFTILHVSKEIINEQYSKWLFKNKTGTISFAINEFDHERFYRGEKK